MIKIGRETKDFLKAMEYHKKRPTRSRRIDESKTSKKKYIDPPKSWFKNPATSDVIGIDSKKYKARNVNEVIGFLKSAYQKPNKKTLQSSDFKVWNNKKGIITFSNTNKITTTKHLQDVIEIRYNNVKVSSRKKKGRKNDFWISVLKN